uniref:Uncharacterized protein n=1 Tax=Palpitomonas bilix TaxID=652834 RepID=A0A7S3CY91_9EUKA
MVSDIPPLYKRASMISRLLASLEDTFLIGDILELLIGGGSSGEGSTTTLFMGLGVMVAGLAVFFFLFSSDSHVIVEESGVVEPVGEEIISSLREGTVLVIPLAPHVLDPDLRKRYEDFVFIQSMLEGHSLLLLKREQQTAVIEALKGTSPVIAGIAALQRDDSNEGCVVYVKGKRDKALVHVDYVEDMTAVKEVLTDVRKPPVEMKTVSHLLEVFEKIEEKASSK